jgi:hypothetical protein
VRPSPEERATYRRGIPLLIAGVAVVAVLLVVRLVAWRHQMRELDSIPEQAMSESIERTAVWLTQYCADAGADSTLCEEATPRDGPSRR